MRNMHFALVPEKRSALGTLLKLGLAAGGAYLAYQYVAERKKEGGLSPNAGTEEAALGFDREAHAAEDFAARVLKAAKRVPDLLGR